MKALHILAFFASTTLFIGCVGDKTTTEKSFENLFPIQRSHKDSAVRVTKKEFAYLLQKGTSLASTKKVEELSPEEHVLLIMLANTKPIYFKKKGYKEITPAYKKFDESLKNLQYAKQMRKLFEGRLDGQDGIYFPKLDINMGTSRRFDWGVFELKG